LIALSPEGGFQAEGKLGRRASLRCPFPYRHTPIRFVPRPAYAVMRNREQSHGLNRHGPFSLWMNSLCSQEEHSVPSFSSILEKASSSGTAVMVQPQ